LSHREKRRAELVAFLRTIQRPGCPIEQISDDESLVDAGLIDSLATLEIVTYLETTYRLDLAARGIDPADIVTINGVLALIELEIG
jgi:acyl carrier protein